MGKYALILTFGLIMFTTILSSQGMETDRDTSDSQADRQKTVLARQITKSVFDRGISELRRDYRSEDRDVKIDPFSGGTVQHKGVSFRLQDSSPDRSEELPALGVLKSGDISDGVTSISARGYYEDASYRIAGDVIRDVDGFSALGVDGGLNSAKGNSGSFRISGLDTDPVDKGKMLEHGSGQGYNRPAIRFNDQGAYNLVKAEGKFDSDQVVGVDERDIVQDEKMKVVPDNLAQEIRQRAAYTGSEVRKAKSIGSRDEPAIAAVDGDLKLAGNFRGVGALVVDGDLKMRGNAQWEGIVIVTNKTNSEERSTNSKNKKKKKGKKTGKPVVDIGGSAKVYGSLTMRTGGNGRLVVKGNSRLQYSSSALTVMDDLLPALDKSVTLEVTNRSTKMFELDS